MIQTHKLTVFLEIPINNIECDGKICRIALFTGRCEATCLAPEIAISGQATDRKTYTIN